MTCLMPSTVRPWAVKSPAPAAIPVLNGVLPFAVRALIAVSTSAALEVPRASLTDEVVPLKVVRPTW